MEALAALLSYGPPDRRIAKGMLNLSDLFPIKNFRFPRPVIGYGGRRAFRSRTSSGPTLRPKPRSPPRSNTASTKGLNDRAEASHRHTRRREKIMGRFKSPGQTQRFLSAHDQIASLIRPRQHRHTARSYVMRGQTCSAFGPTMPRIWPPENRDGDT